MSKRLRSVSPTGKSLLQPKIIEEELASSKLTTQSFARYDSYFFTHSLVGVEIQRETSIIFLNDYPGGFFHRFCPDTTLKEQGFFWQVVINVNLNNEVCLRKKSTKTGILRQKKTAMLPRLL